MRTRLHAVAITALCALFGAAGCKSCDDNSATEDGGTHAQTSSLTPEQAAKVLAKVGDGTITLGDYVAALEHMDQFDRLRYQSPERRKELLDELIEVELLAQEATTKGYDKDPVAQQELRTVLRDAMLKEARAGAPQWGELVRKLSIDAQAKANVPVDLAGDFGLVAPPGDARGDNPRVPAEVRTAAFEIEKKDDVLGRVVKSGDKYYVVRMTQKNDAHERSFSEAERAIRVRIAQDRAKSKEDETYQSLRKQFPVKIDEAALAQVKVGAN